MVKIKNSDKKRILTNGKHSIFHMILYEGASATVKPFNK